MISEFKSVDSATIDIPPEFSVFCDMDEQLKGTLPFKILTNNIRTCERTEPRSESFVG